MPALYLVVLRDTQIQVLYGSTPKTISKENSNKERRWVWLWVWLWLWLWLWEWHILQIVLVSSTNRFMINSDYSPHCGKTLDHLATDCKCKSPGYFLAWTSKAGLYDLLKGYAQINNPSQCLLFVYAHINLPKMIAAHIEKPESISAPNPQTIGQESIGISQALEILISED